MIDRYIQDVLEKKECVASRHSIKPRLTWWKQGYGHYALADVTPAMIAEARDALLNGTTRLKKTHSPTTVIHYLATLRHCYNIAITEWEWIDFNPVAKVKKPQWPQGRVRFLDDTERKALLEVCRKSPNPCLYDIVVLALSSGMRYSEIMNLTWADVDLNRAVVILQETKNGERRAVPLVGHAMDCIKERSRIRRLDNPHVFPAPRNTGEPINIQTSWRKAVKEAGITDFHFHDLRHSAASYLAMNGATTAELAEILGHKTLAMVKRYSHLSQSHTSKVLERMTTAIFAEPETDSVNS
jgi:integrase